MVDEFIASLKSAVKAVVMVTPDAPEVGDTALTVGAGAAVVKDQL
jgi:hypothetical protein